MSKNKDLTAREDQVAKMLVQGLSNREIATKLDISQKTVDTHRGHLLQKLGLKNNVELTLHGVAVGWVTPRAAKTVAEPSLAAA